MRVCACACVCVCVNAYHVFTGGSRHRQHHTNYPMHGCGHKHWIRKGGIQTIRDLACTSVQSSLRLLGRERLTYGKQVHHCMWVRVCVSVFVCVCVYLCASPQQVKLARFIYSHVMRHIYGLC